MLLQGTDDKVVPPSQTSKMPKIIEKNHGTMKVVTFDGEEHGFREQVNIERLRQEENDWVFETLAERESSRW